MKVLMFPGKSAKNNNKYIDIIINELNNKNINAVEIARKVEDAGGSAIAVHGRTQKQGYSGTANWDLLKEIKKNVSIPVNGNVDVDSGVKAKKMFEETKVDAIFPPVKLSAVEIVLFLFFISKALFFILVSLSLLCMSPGSSKKSLKAK